MLDVRLLDGDGIELCRDLQTSTENRMGGLWCSIRGLESLNKVGKDGQTITRPGETRLAQRGVATLTTNVPGPRQPLHIMGQRVLSVFPVPPIAMQLRTGVAMLSYADDLFFGILADYDAVPDVDALARGIEVAVARLVDQQ